MSTKILSGWNHWLVWCWLTTASACLAIRRIKGRHTDDILTTLIKNLHKEYDVVKKLRGSTTDSGSNFLKAFHESGKASTVHYYENHQEKEEEEVPFFVIGDILNAKKITTIMIPTSKMCRPFVQPGSKGWHFENSASGLSTSAQVNPTETSIAVE